MSELIIGVRAGFGRAVEPAWLTESMMLPAGSVRPHGTAGGRAVPEIAFVMAARLAGPGVTMPAATAAIASVHGAISAEAGGWLFACGPVGLPPGSVDLALEACLVEVGGQVVDSATGAAVAGHPAQALAATANELGRRGLAIEPGWIVLTGGLTQAVDVPAGGTLAVHFTSLGSLFAPFPASRPAARDPALRRDRGGPRLSSGDYRDGELLRPGTLTGARHWGKVVSVDHRARRSSRGDNRNS
jgi:2-keto-4-pentenoate hydratase